MGEEKKISFPKLKNGNRSPKAHLKVFSRNALIKIRKLE